MAGKRVSADIAREFGVTRQAVSIWLKRYKATGHVPRVWHQRTSDIPDLTPEMKAELIEAVRTEPPPLLYVYQALGDPCEWKVGDVSVYLHNRFDLFYSRKRTQRLIEELQLPVLDDEDDEEPDETMPMESEPEPEGELLEDPDEMHPEEEATFKEMMAVYRQGQEDAARQRSRGTNYTPSRSRKKKKRRG